MLADPLPVLTLGHKLPLELQGLIGRLRSKQLHSDLLVFKGHFGHLPRVHALVVRSGRPHPFVFATDAGHQIFAGSEIYLTGINYPLEHLHILLVDGLFVLLSVKFFDPWVVQDFMFDCFVVRGAKGPEPRRYVWILTQNTLHPLMMLLQILQPLHLIPHLPPVNILNPGTHRPSAVTPFHF